MNKKADSMAVIVMLVLLLILIISFLFFSRTIFQRTESKIPEEKCRLSVQREAFVNIAGAQAGGGHTVEDFASNIDCFSLPAKSNSPGSAGAFTAELMEECWKMFGSGSLRLFSRGAGIFCHICYDVEYARGTSIDLSSLLENRRLGSLKGHYDVPAVSDVPHEVIFRYARGLAGNVEQKVFVRSTTPESLKEVCANAVFPRQRK
jgi:hypothetical protein